MTTRAIAVFDFDGTLTNGDSLPRFLWHSLGIRACVSNTLKSLPMLLKYAAGLADNESSKEQLFAGFFAGMSKREFQEKAEAFSLSALPRLVREEAMTQLHWHLDQGHPCLLISASIEDYLMPWARSVGFAAVLATRLGVDPDGNLTGKFLGRNCYAMEKVRRLEAYLGPLANYAIYCYGDSRGDKELLQIADYPFFRSFTHEKAYVDE